MKKQYDQKWLIHGFDEIHRVLFARDEAHLFLPRIANIQYFLGEGVLPFQGQLYRNKNGEVFQVIRYLRVGYNDQFAART